MIFQLFCSTSFRTFFLSWNHHELPHEQEQNFAFSHLIRNLSNVWSQWKANILTRTFNAFFRFVAWQQLYPSACKSFHSFVLTFLFIIFAKLSSALLPVAMKASPKKSFQGKKRAFCLSALIVWKKQNIKLAPQSTWLSWCNFTSSTWLGFSNNEIMLDFNLNSEFQQIVQLNLCKNVKEWKRSVLNFYCLTMNT